MPQEDCPFCHGKLLFKGVFGKNEKWQCYDCHRIYTGEGDLPTRLDVDDIKLELGRWI